MITENKILMAEARESLRNKWGTAVAAFFIYLVISTILAIIPILGSIAIIIIDGPLVLGIAIFSLSISRNSESKINQIFDGFKNFGTSFAAYVLTAIFTILWILLLIVPGIIASLSYSLTFFLIADNPGIDPLEAIRLSKKMMYGYKWKLFCLYFRFFWWFLLCFLTLGIGFLWLVPYVEVTKGKFYDDVKANYNPEMV